MKDRILLISVMLAVGLPAGLPAAAAAEPVDIGSRRELFVDDFLIDTRERVELRLHRPAPREVVVVHDQPWEGSGSGYHTIFRDGPIYRMYYKAWQLSPTKGKLNVPHPTLGAYAESSDGIHWMKPELGLFEFAGSKKNNIVWQGPGSHDFTPFKDLNPNCQADAKYKAVGNAGGSGGNLHGLLAFKSADGIHWSRLQQEPIITEGAFDTQNLAFWDPVRGQYRAYIRAFHRHAATGQGMRDVRTATSDDFVHWTDPVMLDYPGRPDEQLYTNQIAPYYRAPHILIGFPTRYIDRGWSASMEALPQREHRRLRSSAGQRYGTALTEGLFMTSRDGRTFRRWGEAFLPAGYGHPDSWKYGDNYIAWHVVETRSAIEGRPNELSLYATESYWTGHSSRLRRFTLRLDGFVSLHAGGDAGQMVTRPLTFSGTELALNFSTSAAGSIRVEVQDAGGQPIEGYRLADCPDLFGDDTDRIVSWKSTADISKLAGRPVRLRFTLQDADLYSLRFRP